MKKIILLLSIFICLSSFGQILVTQKYEYSNNQIFDKTITIGDSIIARYHILKKQTYLPYHPSAGATVNYNGTLQYWDGLTWNVIENSGNKGVANGYASLDVNGKIPSNEMYFLTSGYPYVVTHLSQMLALDTAKKGDVCVVGDSSKSYMLQHTPASTYSNWVWLKSPFANLVVSVNGYVGAITLHAHDLATWDSVKIKSLITWPIDSSGYNSKALTNAELAKKVDKTTTINTHPLSSNISLTGSDLGLAVVASTNNYNDLNNKPPTDTINKIATKHDLTLKLDKSTWNASVASKITPQDTVKWNKKADSTNV